VGVDNILAVNDNISEEKNARNHIIVLFMRGYTERTTPTLPYKSNIAVIVHSKRSPALITSECFLKLMYVWGGQGLYPS